MSTTKRSMKKYLFLRFPLPRFLKICESKIKLPCKRFSKTSVIGNRLQTLGPAIHVYNLQGQQSWCEELGCYSNLRAVITIIGINSPRVKNIFGFLHIHRTRTGLLIMLVKKSVKLNSVSCQLLQKEVTVAFFKVSIIHPKKILQ